MKKIIEIYILCIATIATAIGGAYVLSILFSEFPKFKATLNSPFFSSVVTLVVGLIAYILYLKQKNDAKQDIAKLILQEIRFAENEIRRVNQKGNADYFLSRKLLPTNSWHKNIHVFISDLDQSQVDMISEFYTRAEYLDYLIKIISDRRTSGMPPQQITLINNPTGEPSQSSTQIQIDPAHALLNIVTTQEIEYIYNSAAVDTLRKIAKS